MLKYFSSKRKLVKRIKCLESEVEDLKDRKAMAEAQRLNLSVALSDTKMYYEKRIDALEDILAHYIIATMKREPIPREEVIKYYEEKEKK